STKARTAAQTSAPRAAAQTAGADGSRTWSCTTSASTATIGSSTTSFTAFSAALFAARGSSAGHGRTSQIESPPVRMSSARKEAVQLEVTMETTATRTNQVTSWSTGTGGVAPR